MKSLILFLIGGLASVAINFAPDEPAPAPVAKTELGSKIGQMCVLEFRVAAVKHSERRSTRYLNSTTNFRSEENVGAAIDEKAFEQFRAAGAEDLEAKYLNQPIRVRGQVIRDEGQILLKVTSPKDIEVVTADAPAPAVAKLLVKNEQGKEIALKFPLEGVARHKVEVEHNDVKETYEGVALADVLERAEIKLGAEARGELVSRYVLVTATDRYSAVLAISEIDPFLSPQTILLADRVNGAPLAEADGPLRLIVPSDKRHRRWVRQVVKVEVRQASEKDRAVAPAADK